LLGRTAEPVNQMVDEKKLIYGFNFPEYILVAKDYIYGYIVSCHSQAVGIAMNQQKPLIMYLDEDEKFYEFSAEDIINNHDKNIKGGIVMMNFDIHLGKNFKYVAKQEVRTWMVCPSCGGALERKQDEICGVKLDFVCDAKYGVPHYWSQEYIDKMRGLE
jgi:hypothetical protein